MWKNKIYKYIAIYISVLFIFTLIMLNQGCKKVTETIEETSISIEESTLSIIETMEPTFGEIIICEEINIKTGAPINPKNEFGIDVNQICVAIELFHIKGADTYCFKCKNENTGCAQGRTFNRDSTQAQ